MLARRTRMTDCLIARGAKLALLGNGGGGVCLTRLGESLVDRYRALEGEFARLALSPRPENTDRGYSSFPWKPND